jgi:hypothetical protein
MLAVQRVALGRAARQTQRLIENNPTQTLDQSLRRVFVMLSFVLTMKIVVAINH